MANGPGVRSPEKSASPCCFKSHPCLRCSRHSTEPRHVPCPPFHRQNIRHHTTCVLFDERRQSRGKQGLSLAQCKCPPTTAGGSDGNGRLDKRPIVHGLRLTLVRPTDIIRLHKSEAMACLRYFSLENLEVRMCITSRRRVCGSPLRAAPSPRLRARYRVDRSCRNGHGP